MKIVDSAEGVEASETSVIETREYESTLCGTDEQLTIKQEVRQGRTKKEVLASLTEEQRLKMKAEAFDYLISRMKDTGDDGISHLVEAVADLVEDDWDFLDVQQQ